MSEEEQRRAFLRWLTGFVQTAPMADSTREMLKERLAQIGFTPLTSHD